jgi:iron complex transport system permease protein
LRLPRIALAVLVGAGLSIGGAAFQGMFRNPLVSPEILGVSAAAGFGAAVGILLSNNAVLIQVLAFGFGIGGVGLTYAISQVHRTPPVVMLVLSGVIVASMFSALISVTLYVADPQQKLPAITFWLLGGLGGATWQKLAFAGPLIGVGTLGLLLVSWRINLLAMGDDEARALGLPSNRLRVFIVVCVTLITATIVSISGVIGWVGLVIPHVARMLVGPEHRVLLPSTLALGAAYLLAVDAIARTATQAEIPVGILTAVIGASFFAVLLRRSKGGWGSD